MTARRTIGVLAGGDSPERDISLISGSHIHRALREKGHNAALLSIGSLDDIVPQLRGIDVAFNCLHGGSGEDGTVQLLLDVMGIPYAGSGARACWRAMEKPRARAIFTAQRIPIPAGHSYEGGDLATFMRNAIDRLGFPMVVKPGNGGSTVAVSFVESEEQLREAADSILNGFTSLVVEEYVEGREITVGILRQGDRDTALPVIEIRIPGRLFDYEAKYTDGVAEFLAPAPLDASVAEHLQDVSFRAHEALGCSGYSRVDLRLGDDGRACVLEVNTLPGMTPMSDLPRAAAAAGIEYGQLVDLMLSTANKESGE